MAKKKLQLDLESDLIELAQAGADSQGKTISECLEKGESIQSLAHNAANQALWRLLSKGTYPTALITEAKEEAARIVAARTAGAQA